MLRGFRDYLPAEMIPKARMLDTITQVFESFGYPPVQTPALEYSEVLLGKYGEEGDMLMYRFRDNGDRDVCMRYDLTVPLARLIAEHAELPMPFRRYQIAPVWRAEKPAKGRYREFMQCDVDLVGSDDPSADAEMILIGMAVLRALAVPGFEVRMNHRGVLRGLTHTLGVPDGEREGAFLRLLDKLPKIGRDAFVESVRSELALAPRATERLLELLEGADDRDAALALMDAAVGEDADGAAGVARLREVSALVEAGGFGSALRIDPSIARGLGYYTGIIYETILERLAAIGSVMSGGRYDELVGMFSGRRLPAVGISLGIDRLFAALEELAPAAVAHTPARVMVTRFEDVAPALPLRLAMRLREAGVSALLYPSEAKLKKQLQYASALGLPYVAILGGEEAAAGEVTIKNLESGTQERLKVEAAVELLSRHAPGRR